MLQTYNPANANLIVNINGKLVSRHEAGVSPFDSAVQNGDAVWEGLRLYNGGIFRLTQHLARLRKSAAMLQYAGYPTDEHLFSELKRTLVANNMTDGVHIRLTVSRGLKYTSGLDPRINTAGCSVFILPEHKPPVYDKAGITLMTARICRPFATVLDQHIHSCNQLTSILAKLEANAVGADDALMLDTEGLVAETNATHVFIVRNGILETSTTRACPDGITRQAVLEICDKHGIPHAVGDIPHAELFTASEMFCTGTMGELVPVTRLDQHDFPVGPVCQNLTQKFRELVADPAESTRVI